MLLLIIETFSPSMHWSCNRATWVLMRGKPLLHESALCSLTDGSCCPRGHPLTPMNPPCFFVSTQHIVSDSSSNTSTAYQACLTVRAKGDIYQFKRSKGSLEHK